ncbi:hypothetical protein C0216_19225 [Streptomyces globosus]|uniref:DUF742 domain-containing protein n=1 Tax=Streptomyces globosus TaxID=68209 RepID=A0A344U322_9ACTN|nr:MULTISPECIES: DUF742 domain-containing protein [Streptomyces]AXE25293.1 hypothetical protein C0216_19225 [Streptomyces globosus]
MPQDDADAVPDPGPEPEQAADAAADPAPDGGGPLAPRSGGRRRTRLYALTDGRTAAPCTVMTMDTTITAAVPEDAWSGLPSEWRAVLAMCPAPDGRAVAEIAARMHIRLTPMALLLGELADRGLIHHRPPLDGAEAADVHLLRRIRDNLARI